MSIDLNKVSGANEANSPEAAASGPNLAEELKALEEANPARDTEPVKSMHKDSKKETNSADGADKAKSKGKIAKFLAWGIGAIVLLFIGKKVLFRKKAS